MAQLTMKDIAARVGVSRAAVSFVLSGQARQRGISTRVERDVLRAAKELGYRPSLVAQSLARRRTMTVGLFLPNMGVTYGPPLAEAIERAAELHGYQIILGHHHGDPKQFAKTLDAMLSWNVDGILAVPLIGMAKMPVHARFASAGVPRVLLETDIGDDKCHLVTTDVAQATRMAVSHLVGLGHRRIAMLNSSNELLESRHRAHAFRQALYDAGTPVDDDLIISAEIDQTPQQAFATAKHLLEHPKRPTAIVAVSASRAESVYYAACEQKLDIPADLSVVAMTGNQFTDFQKMRFTNARLTYAEVGEAAFSILKGDIDGGPLSPRRVLTSPIWEEGLSTGPAPLEGASK